MSSLLRKYATATATGTHVAVPMIKAGSQDFAGGADWTPAVNDVKVSIDDGTLTNIGTLPSYVNGKWVFPLTGPELTGKSICIVVVDAATKAVEDQFILVETFGHALAMFTSDFSDPLANFVPGSYSSGTAGKILGDNLDAQVSSRSTIAPPVPILNPEALTGTVVSATTTQAVVSVTGGVPSSGQVANAYGGGSNTPARYLTFTSGANKGQVVTITGSSYSAPNLTLNFAATTGVVAASAGNTVQID